MNQNKEQHKKIIIRIQRELDNIWYTWNHVKYQCNGRM